MVTFGLLKTNDKELVFGFEKKTPAEITNKNNKKIIVIPIKNTLCLCFGDINTTAIV